MYYAIERLNPFVNQVLSDLLNLLKQFITPRVLIPS